MPSNCTLCDLPRRQNENIKESNIEIINALSAIKELMEIKLPSNVSWNLTKNMKKLIPAFNDFDEAEKKLIEEYAVKDDKGNIKFVGENQFKINRIEKRLGQIIEGKEDEFINKKNELMQFEDTIDIHMIKFSDLSKVEVKGTTLFSLEFLIDDDEESSN